MSAQETNGVSRFSVPTRRDVMRLAVDGVAWFLGMFFAAYARFDFSIDNVVLLPLIGFAFLAVALQWLIGTALFLYRGRYRYGSFDEVSGVATTVIIVGVILSLADRLLFTERPVPASTPLVGAFVALVLMLGVRYIWRVRIERSARPDAEVATKVLIFGAGEAGSQLVMSMMRDSASPYYAVGFIDDDPRVRNLRVKGVPVIGTRSAIPDAAAATGATAVVIAIASASASLVREITDTCESAGLRVKILPSLSELIDGQVSSADIRDVNEADLLGRHIIQTDIESIAHYLTGRRVLVTGAGGSIGSELCRQIHRFEPAELIMLDRDESALHAVELSIHGRALLDDDSTVLADIRDVDRIREIFAVRRPHVVFHAAALKHLPMLERAPAEAVKSNVWGTQHVLDAAVAVDVERFVNISTDKAANPISVLGYSKRLAEGLTSGVAERAKGTYLSVRFGNVLGSRGSVLTTFAQQIEDGGPVTVTHPDVTRYFMTVPEAVQLVIQAAAIGGDAEALVLDMGEPVRISDVARHLISQSGDSAEIVYTGLRPGEKLHEELFGDGEVGVRTSHPLISHVPVKPVTVHELQLLERPNDDEATRNALRQLVLEQGIRPNSPANASPTQ